MAIIIPEGYAQVIISYASVNFVSGNAATVFGMGAALGPDPATFEYVANEVGTQWGTHLGPRTDNNVVMTTVEVIGSEDSAIATFNTAGGRSSPSAPPSACVLAKKVVSGRGRRRQGRMFLPGLLGRDDITEDGTIFDTPLGVIAGQIESFFLSITGEDLAPMVILQNSEGVTPPISPPPVVLSLSTQPKIASQRRRLRK